MGAEKKNDQKNPTEQNVSYFEIFRYATWLELTATIFGVIFGLLSGGGICYNMVQIGELSTAFVERTTNINRESSYLPLTQAFGGGRRLFNASYEENMAALLEDAKAIAIGMFLSIVISLIFVVLSVLLVSWSALRQITRIRMKFLNAVLRQDMSWFDTDSEFNLASKMTENLMSLKEGMGEKLSMVSNLVGTSIICICTSFPMGWELTLACLSIMPFSLAASIMLTNYQTKSSMLEMKSYSQAGKQAEEVLKSIRTIVAFNGESKEVAKYSRLLQPAEKQGRKRGLYSGLGNGFNWILTYALNTIGLMYGTRLIVQGYDKAADDSSRYVVGVVFSILFNTYMATQSITFSVPHVEVFASARGAAASIFFLIDRQPKIDSLQTGGLCPRRVTGDICLEDIHFNYPSRTEVKILKGFSLRIKAGECVALVGSSGCGKSTILQLLQRLYDPQCGVIKLDEKDIKSLNIGWLRSCLGVVGQEPVLFHGTIFENIAIGVPDATLTAVQRVAEMAYAHDFITKLPHGYDTVIGERGASLSGGQKQRIAIARSLLREPAVLLLDEATSALDPNSERQVQIALDRASVGRTTISVSHRLSTIINADRIICMDQGAIVEEGTHKELMKKQGFYYKLVTTGKESKDVEEIETLSEGGDGEQNINDQISVSRTDLKRKSTKSMRQMHRQRQSIKRGSQDWMTPRGSFASVISAGLQNFAHNSEFKAADEQLKPLSNLEILKLNSPEWVLIVIGSIAAFVQGVCFPAFALIFGFSSGIFVLTDRDLIIYYADLYSGMFILVAAVAGISMCLQSVTFTTAGLKMTTRLRIKYFTALLAQEIGYFDRESNTVGAMCARLSGDAAEVQGATGLRIGLILQGISSVLVGFIMAMCYNWKLTLVGTVFLPLMVGSIWLEGIVSQQSQSDERAAMESATAIATEAVVSIRTVQSLGVETIFLKKFQEGLVEACSAIIKKARWRGLVLGSGAYVPFMAFGSATVYGTVLVSRGEMEYRIVLLVNMALMYGAYMLGQSLSYAPGVNSAKTAASRIVSVITRVPKVRTEDGIKDKLDWVASGSFSVNNVEFCYPTRPHQKILKGINLKVEVGMTVALVGSSGCGKSTVLQLMQRFYDPETGNIELDGRDIKTALTLPRLRRQLGVVQQEPVLFDGTLAENIAYGDNSRKVTMQEITAAAKAANIHSFIVSLPEGYNTNLGSSGAQLSGGQKQRVCIARALIRSPRLLLLDEATSALDANSERTVSEALEKAAKGRTCITIAHRLSTIKDADLICVVDKGKIVEQGTHIELIRQRGQYWRMCRGQNVT